MRIFSWSYYVVNMITCFTIIIFAYKFNGHMKKVERLLDLVLNIKEVQDGG